MKYLKSFILIAVFLLTAATVSNSQTLYGAGTGQQSGNAPSNLYMINPITGDATLIGPIGFNGVTGLEMLPDGRLIASANADTENEAVAVLIEIDKTTGAGTLIGVLGNSENFGECGRMPDISYEDSTNTLFGYSDSCRGGMEEIVESGFDNFEGLYIINPDNADVNFVGPSGFTDGGNGLAVRPTDGRIFNTPIDANGLVILNRNTGAGTVIPASVGNVPIKIGALDFDSNNVLYGVFKEEKRRMAEAELNGEEEPRTFLIILNQSNGLASTVGQTVDGLDAIVFAEGVSQVPTLSEYGLILTAILLLAGAVVVLRKRNKILV